MTWTSLCSQEIRLGSKSVKVEVLQDGGRLGLKFNGYPALPLPFDPYGNDEVGQLLLSELLPVKLGLAIEEVVELHKVLAGKEFLAGLDTTREDQSDWEDDARKYADVQAARDEISAIFAIPDREMKSREKYDSVTKVGYKHLFSNGRFYFNERPFDGYWFDSASKVLYKLPSSAREGEKFQTFLADRLNLNREDIAFRWLISGIQAHVAQHATKIRPCRFSFFDKHSFVLYVNNKPGRMLKIDGGEPQEVDNGEDEVLFVWDDRWQPWDYCKQEPNQDLWRLLIYSRFSLDEQQNAPTLTELCALLDAYVQGILFREIVPHRPILANVGPFGCGKTSAALWIGLALFGSVFQVIGLEEEKQDSVIAYVTNNVYGVLDNADEKVKWLPDLLARVATGQSIPKRKLYTTNELIEYAVDIFIAITARSTPWARPDVVSRLLLLPFKQPETFLSEEKLKEAILTNRNALLAELVSKAAESLRRLKVQDSDSEIQSPTRLAGFYTFGQRVSQDSGAFRSGFEKVILAQAILTFEEQETLISVLRQWIEANSSATLGGQGERWTQPMAASAIFGELSTIAKEKGLRLEIKTPNGLGMVLRNIKPTLVDQGISFKVTRRAKANYWSFSLRGGP